MIQQMYLVTENLYCNMCVLNVIKAISKLKDVKEFDIDVDKGAIYLEFVGPAYNEDYVKSLIESALVCGVVA